MGSQQPSPELPTDAAMPTDSANENIELTMTIEHITYDLLDDSMKQAMKDASRTWKKK